MATVTLTNVHKSYGGTEVIHGVDVDIKNGEFIVIVGPSGCGKSTLLRMVAGLETVTKGDIHIDGNRVNDLEPMDRNIAMVFQNYALYPHMNVHDNMAYGLKIAGTPKAEIEERVNKAADMLELGPYLKRRPRELSGGQRQRVAMGRAIVRKPALFLFDEPLSNLDAKLRVQMRLEIKDLQRDLGITALYVTHDQVEAMTLADRMIVMNDGVAEQIGVPLEVYNNPQSMFVGGFIGSPPMNFLTAETFAANEADEASALLERILPNRLEGVKTIGIRPEHITIGAPDRAMLAAKTRFVEPLGAETLVHLVLNTGEHITARQDGAAALPEPGATCLLGFEAQSACLFDGAGKRIRPG